MFKTYLELIYFISIIYLSLFYIKLSRNVVNQRRLTKTPIGFKSVKLERAIRAHANFVRQFQLTFF